MYRRSAKLEKYLGNRERERELLEEGLKKFPDNDKLWVMLAEYQQGKTGVFIYLESVEGCFCVWLGLSSALLLCGFLPKAGLFGLRLKFRSNANALDLDKRICLRFVQRPSSWTRPGRPSRRAPRIAPLPFVSGMRVRSFQWGAIVVMHVSVCFSLIGVAL